VSFLYFENYAGGSGQGGDYEVPAEFNYVPRDENFSHVKTKEFLQLGTKTLGERVEPLLLSLYLKTTGNEFNGFEEVQKLYEGGVNLPLSLTPNGAPSVLKFPKPSVIQGNLVTSHSNITTLITPFVNFIFFLIIFFL